MNLYYAQITDVQGTPVITLELTATAKHSAFLASKYIDFCPPAQGFIIKKQRIEAKAIARILNTYTCND